MAINKEAVPVSEVATFRADAQGVIRNWNDAMERLTGFSRAEVLGKVAASLQCQGCAEPTCPFAPQDLGQLAKLTPGSEETCLRHRDGRILPVLKTAQLEHGPDNAPSGISVELVSLPESE